LNIVQVLKSESVDHEILVVNNTSKDNTLQVQEMKQKSINSLSILTNQGPNGFGYAMRYDLEGYSGDRVAMIMADISDDPEDLTTFYNKMKAGNFDCAFGSRFKKGGILIDYPFI
jgi:dolichol-phosphate mannosyltransferase